jgi:hypothetical protein
MRVSTQTRVCVCLSASMCLAGCAAGCVAGCCARTRAHASTHTCAYARIDKHRPCVCLCVCLYYCGCAAGCVASTHVGVERRQRVPILIREEVVLIDHLEPRVGGVDPCGGLRENGSSFLSFPYVCPEPVLVTSAFVLKNQHFNIQMAKKARFFTWFGATM